MFYCFRQWVDSQIIMITSPFQVQMNYRYRYCVNSVHNQIPSQDNLFLLSPNSNCYFYYSLHTHWSQGDLMTFFRTHQQNISWLVFTQEVWPQPCVSKRYYISIGVMHIVLNCMQIIKKRLTCFPLRFAAGQHLHWGTDKWWRRSRMLSSPSCLLTMRFTQRVQSGTVSVRHFYLFVQNHILLHRRFSGASS